MSKLNPGNWRRGATGRLMAAVLALAGMASPGADATFVPANANPGKEAIIRLGEKQDGALVFDTELVRLSGGWTGTFAAPLQFVPRAEFAANLATLVFASSNRPGWGMKGNLKDPRATPAGPLPAEWAAYRGLYQAGSRVVLSYSVGSSSVLEAPDFDSATGIFTRTISVDKSEVAMALLVCNVPPRPGKREFIEKMGNGQFGYIALSATNETTVAAIQGAPKEASWESVDGMLYLRLPPFDKPGNFRVSIWRGDQDEGLTRFVETISKTRVIPEPKALLGASKP